MKNIYIISLLLLWILQTATMTAQTSADSQMKQAQELLEKREYHAARSLFYKAYCAFAADGRYDKATLCGVKSASTLHRENKFKEAFDMLRAVDEMIMNCEKSLQHSRPDLRYATVKERMLIYTRLKQAPRAKEQLARMESLAQAAANDSISGDLLYTQANLYYTFGMTGQGDAAISRLISKYKDAKQYDKLLSCYQSLIDFARKGGNAAMTARAYEQYIIWKDSVRVLHAKDELAALQKDCRAKQTIIEEKDSSLAARMYVIVFLCVVCAILAVALILGGIVLLRYVLLTRKQKKAIEVAEENNGQKSEFIRNISAQMSPTLSLLDAKELAVKALKDFVSHIEELSEMERQLAEPFETQETKLATFCENLAAKMEGKLHEGVKMVVNAPKLSIPLNAPMVERILLHLLENAAIYTPANGKVTLEYKRRGAHTHQFLVTDTGCGIDASKHSSIFKPFSEVRDLTKGDGLGLPICALLATRMNGTLSVDAEYVKGARFVLEIHA